MTAAAEPLAPRVRRSGWPLLRSVAHDQRAPLLVSTLGALVWLGFGIAVPMMVGWTVQRGIVESSRNAVWIGGLAIVGLGLGEATCDALRHRSEMLASERARARLRVSVAAAALEHDDRNRDTWSSGQLVARGTSDADSVAGAIEATGYTVAYTVAIPVVLGLLLSIDVVLAAIVVVTVAASMVATWRLSSTWEHRAEATQEALGDTIASAQQVIEGFKVIAGVGGGAATLADYSARSRAARDRATHTARLWTMFSPAIATMAGAATLTAIVVGGLRVIDGSIEIGGVVAAIGLALFLVTPVEAVGSGIIALRSALASASRLSEVVDPAAIASPDPTQTPAGANPPADADAPLLAVESLDFGFPGSAFRIHDVSFAARRGQLVVIDGPIGSGKSVLAALLSGEQGPYRGTIEIAGTALERFDADAHRRAVLRISAQPFLLAESIVDNVRLAAPDATDAEVAEAMQIADADEFVDRLTDGRHTVLADRGASLSGGQRQRLALARAILAQPDVLVIDGAMSGLEPERQLTVLRSIVARWGHGVVVAISPNRDVRALADVVVGLPPPSWQPSSRAPSGDDEERS